MNDRRAVKAALEGTTSYGLVADAHTMERYPLPRPGYSRLRCYSGYGGRATHTVACNGLGMMSEYHLGVLRWVREAGQ